ncbi:hypothetical protein GCM10027612_02940 [Microbispora bryophytorum subsp. camponoti]
MPSVEEIADLLLAGVDGHEAHGCGRPGRRQCLDDPVVGAGDSLHPFEVLQRAAQRFLAEPVEGHVADVGHQPAAGHGPHRAVHDAAQVPRGSPPGVTAYR